MGYQLTSLAVAVPAPEFPQCVAALAEIDTLDTDTAGNAAEIMALHDAGVTPSATYGAAFDYLLTALYAEVSRLRRFAASPALGSGAVPASRGAREWKPRR